MIENAEKHAEEDKTRKAGIEAKNDAENIISSTEKSMNEFKDQLDKEEEQKIRQKITELREILSAEEVDPEAVKTKCGELQTDSLGLFEKVYKSKQAETGSAGSASEGETVEAKAEDVKEEKKP